MTDGAWDFEVAVVGGGPGGSSAATALARRGRKVVLFERERFPRFHIGESQLPWSNEVFRALGVEQAVRDAGFVPKWGASFRRPGSDHEQYADFASAAQTPAPQTFQVLRERFDEVLLRHAQASGVEVREKHRVLDAAFSDDGVVLRSVDATDAERSVRVGAVVDASGRSAFLVRRFGRHAYDPLLRNISFHAHYEGVPRLEGRRAGDIRMFTREDMGWLWFIPVSETLMSVGAVIPTATHRGEDKASPEQNLAHYLAGTPQAAALLERARRVSEVRADADYSYLAEPMSGGRWVAVGDAAAFLDPIFSTGVLLAMQGGLEAAEAIDAGLRRGRFTAGTFARYERRVRRRYHHFRRFATGFYDPAFRDLWFSPRKDSGIYGAIVSVLAGNWRPSLATRARIAAFFALVALRRLERRLRGGAGP